MAKADDHIGTFFAAYPDFDYEPTNEVWSEYRRLVKHYGWNTKSKKEKKPMLLFESHSWSNLDRYMGPTRTSSTPFSGSVENWALIPFRLA
ncbi:transcription factor Zn, C2H2 [Metarhizium brunneum]